MTIKVKSSMTTNSGAKGEENLLSGKLNAALDLFHGQKKEAAATLQALLLEARETGNVGMIRTINTTLSVIQARESKSEALKESPALVATMHLNLQESEVALEVLDKALSVDADDPRLNFLKATALVQLGKVELAAEALEKAIAVDPGIQVLFRLERDFDSVRYGAAFAAFDRD